MYKCTKNTITWQILNLVTFWSGFWSTGWDKWSLMGHPVTKSSPYGSDVKTCTWLKSVCWSRLSGSTPFSYRPRGPDGFCHTSIWVMGRTVLSDRRPWANIYLFLYRQNDSQFCCKNYTTKCQFLTLVKHFYLSGVDDFDEFRAKTAQNWQIVKKVKKVWNYQLILTSNF